MIGFSHVIGAAGQNSFIWRLGTWLHNSVTARFTGKSQNLDIRMLEDASDCCSPVNGGLLRLLIGGTEHQIHEQLRMVGISPSADIGMRSRINCPQVRLL